MGLLPTLLRRPDNILSMPLVGETLPGRRPGFVHGDPRQSIPGACAAWEAAEADAPMPWVAGTADLLLAPYPAPGREAESLVGLLGELDPGFPVALYERERPLWPNLLLADGTADPTAPGTHEDGLRVFRSSLRQAGRGRAEAFLVAPAGRLLALFARRRRAYLRRDRLEPLLNRRHLVTSWEARRAETALQASVGEAPPLPLEPASRVLVVMPHFDDESLQCGGAILDAVSAGAEVELLWLTDGRRGISTVSEQESARRRHAEAEEAAARLGVKDWTFLDAPETRLRARGPWTAALRRRLLDFRPERVHTVWFGDNNLDHFEANRVLMAAWPRELAQVEVAASGLWQPLPAWNRVLPLTPERAAARAHAIEAHASQVGEVDYLRAGRGLAAFHARGTAAAEAEAFWLLPAREYFAAFRATGMPRRLFL